MLNNCPAIARWEHFQHGADIGIRGIGVTKSQAFEQTGLALTAVVVLPEKIRDLTGIGITCNSTDDEFFFLDWINALIFEMTTCNMLFSRCQVSLDGAALLATRRSARCVQECE